MNKSANITDKQNNQELIIEGAGCGSCVGKIEAALKSINGVDSSEMNFALRTVSVTGEVASEVLIKAIETLGYNAENA
ncbi:MAG: cation transporter [Colwellia polaris]|jgi:copper chaperone CopZ|uniref:cation transporter n=1 Tax=Colwellia polaris TaxID=326537 RepID=UPI000A1728F2|nr:cation transporter [Colwellia polaris]|tara:strand:+ start:1707 stop:1940 length:234 start_codon:yes stop_codon:yes gene_type:complete